MKAITRLATEKSIDDKSPQGSVVIPAHNEEQVIGRLLAPLSNAVRHGEFEVIVACNGCTDRTAEIARSFPGVSVIELKRGSKPAALNAADSVAQSWPRIYLDADVNISVRAIRAVLNYLADDSTPRAARPPFRYDVGGASAYVRSFYRARSRIATTSDRLWGAGVYALNAHARRKFTNFPTVIADDLFVDGQFTPRQKTILETDPVIVSTPRTIRTLISILRRTYRGNSELAASNLLAVSPNPTSGTLAELLRNSRRPSELLDSAVYVASVIFASRVGLEGGALWGAAISKRSSGIGYC